MRCFNNKIGFGYFFFFTLISLTTCAQDSLPRRAYWGINYQERDHQVVLTSVSEGYAFANAGLLVNDIIIGVNGKSIERRQDLANELNNKKAGDEIMLEILSAAKEKSIKLVADPFPYEEEDGIEFQYGSFTTRAGDRLRTIVSKPENSDSKLPAILFVQWLSCDAIDAHPQYKDGNIRLIHDLSKAGYLVMRTEKPGVGDSGGRPCGEYGFNYELEVHREALDRLRNRPDVAANKILLFGSSMGGSMVPILAQNQDLQGLIVTGCYYKSWFEHMIEIERRISSLSSDTPATVDHKIKLWSKFYSLYLNDKMTPGEIIEQFPNFKDLWTEGPEHQYGRPVSYYMEANDHNIPEYWERISIPTLVLYGEYDWIMSREDHVMIAEAMNKKDNGLGTFFEVPKSGHDLTLAENLQDAFDNSSTGYYEPLSDKVLAWLQNVLKY